MRVNFSNISFELLTLVYLVKDDQVLLLRRNSQKKVLPNLLLGLGGKVDPEESFLAGAIREVEEESGYIIDQIEDKGMFAFVDLEDHSGGKIKLYTSKNFHGTELTETVEGELEWHPIDSLLELEDMAKHQFEYLPDILFDSDFIYNKTHIYQGSQVLEILAEIPD